MSKYIFVLDIDDVLRDFRFVIEHYMFVYSKGNDWGKYDYNNPNIKEFMAWIYDTPEFYKMYLNPVPNEKFITFINNHIIYHQDIETTVLSANGNENAKRLNKEFVRNSLVRKVDIDYVKRCFHKVDFIKDKYPEFDRKNIFMIDDRISTIRQFEEAGFSAFWYVNSYDDDVIESNMKEMNYYPKHYGRQEEFENFCRELKILQ